MELNKKIQIEILFAMNPHNFWFRTTEDHMKLKEALDAYVKQYNRDDYQLNLDDWVIMDRNNQWEVGKVGSYKSGYDGKKYCYVSTFSGDIEPRIGNQVYFLDDASIIDMHIQTSRKGSIAGLVPSKNLQTKRRWSDESVKEFQLFVQDAATYFIITKHYNNIHYGEIIREFRCSDMLLEMNFAESADSLNRNSLPENSSTEESISERKMDDSKMPIETACCNGSTVDQVEYPLSPISLHTEPTENVLGNPDSANDSTENLSTFELLDDSNQTTKEMSSISEENRTQSNCLNLLEGDESFAEKSLFDGPLEKSFDARSSGSKMDGWPSPLHEKSIEHEQTHKQNDKNSLSYREPTNIRRASIVSDMTYISSYLQEDSASEEDPDQYQLTEEEFKRRDEEVKMNTIRISIDGLLKNSSLLDGEPITNSPVKLGSMLESCNAPIADEAMARLDKKYRIQGTVWPIILGGRSAILIGHTEWYPQLLYLPAICGSIKKKRGAADYTQKIVITASNQRQARIISNLSRNYLGESDSIVYSNCDDYNLNVFNLKKSKIFVTLPSWIGANREQFPAEISCFIINDFELIPAYQRERIIEMIRISKAQFVITSNCYLDELKQIMIQTPQIFVSLESHYDLFYLTSRGNESRTTSKFEVIGQLSCAETQKQRCSFILEPTIDNVLICSDDQLKKLDVKMANHVIHYDLPDDFETFSYRYSLFEKSHCNFEEKVHDGRKKSEPSSTILFKLESSQRSSFSKKMLLLLSLITRGNKLEIGQRRMNEILETAQRMNIEKTLCTELVWNYTNIDHILKCEHRHCFLDQDRQENARFTSQENYMFEIVDVLSPIYFIIHNVKTVNACGSPDLSRTFTKFSDELNSVYRNSFTPIETESVLNANSLYVVRIKDRYHRCKILDTCIENEPQKVLLELVDEGKRIKAEISDIGDISENFTSFPLQSIHLCLLDLAPSNGRCWNEQDTDHMKFVIFRKNLCGKAFGNGTFEMKIEYEIKSNLIGSFNLTSRNATSGEIEDYAELLISKRIAIRDTGGSVEFLKHAEQKNCLIKHF